MTETSADLHVVLVEDDPDLGFAIVKVFELMGLGKVSHFPSIHSARGHVEWDTVDALVVDFQMVEGREQGGELLSWVHDHHPNVWRVLITAYPWEAVPNEARVHAHVALHKPFLPKMLVEAVQGGAHQRQGEMADVSAQR